MKSVKKNQTLFIPQGDINSVGVIMNYCRVVDGEIMSSLISEKYLTKPETSPTQFPVEYPSGEYIFDVATQKRLPDTLEIVGEKVDLIFNVEDKTQEELDAVTAAIVLAESTAYIQQRKDAHISPGDQFDMQYWDLVNGTTIWKDYVAGIKAQFPKPE